MPSTDRHGVVHGPHGIESAAAPYVADAPLYMTPPSTEAIREQLRAGVLGAIMTPAQGNRLEEGWWWCADNGVFGDAYPGDEDFLAWLTTMRPFADRCLFAVAPDVVGDFFATWRRSCDMLQRIRDLGFPAAIVAQDSMEFCDWWDWDDFDALFIGGSTSWKLSPAAANLARCARSIGHHIHMGRVNSEIRYQYAHHITEAHSADGTYLTYGPDLLLPNVLAWRRGVLTASATHDPYVHDPYDGRYPTTSGPHRPTKPTAVPPVVQPGLFGLFGEEVAA